MEDSGDSYVTPDEHVVNEFMEDLHESKAAASYDVADQQAVAGFIDSIREKKQTLNGLTCGERLFIERKLFFLSFCSKACIP